MTNSLNRLTTEVCMEKGMHLKQNFKRYNERKEEGKF